MVFVLGEVEGRESLSHPEPGPIGAVMSTVSKSHCYGQRQSRRRVPCHPTGFHPCEADTEEPPRRGGPSEREGLLWRGSIEGHL